MKKSILCLLLAVWAGVTPAAEPPSIALGDMRGFDAPAFVRGYYAAYSAKRLDLLVDYYADDVHLVDPTFEIDVHGRDVIARQMAEALPLYEQMTWTPRNVVGAGDRLVVEGEVRGTFTGKPFEMKFVTILQFRDGKIVRHHDYLDSTNFFAQVGRVPPRIKKMLKAKEATQSKSGGQ
jgi:ketosteroid isomerase-like protein